MALAHLVILARNRRIEDGGRAFAQCVDLLAEPLDGGAVTFDLRALRIDLRQFPVESLPFFYALQRLRIAEMARLWGDGGDRKSTRLNSSHKCASRMTVSA